MVKQGFKVRKSRFPWQHIGILEFRFREVRLWTRQIVRAKFRQDRSKSWGGVAYNASPGHKMTHKNWLLKSRITGFVSFPYPVHLCYYCAEMMSGNKHFSQITTVGSTGQERLDFLTGDIAFFMCFSFDDRSPVLLTQIQPH